MKLSDKRYNLMFLVFTFIIVVFGVFATLCAFRGDWAGFAILTWLSLYLHILNVVASVLNKIDTCYDKLEKKIDSILESIEPD